jgi:hypothetical protein
VTLRWAGLLALLLTGCVTDEFVIFGETDACSSSGEAEEAAAEIDAAPVKISVSAEMSSRPAPRARSTTPRTVTLPVDAPAQERR